ncbi:MAG TPA: MBL fold metallo-hydrolase [Candidatus Latescibacteria bacterium]|nr:MBL fold metallo-hydrolase [Candidatus Latescibacterota bacterium]
MRVERIVVGALETNCYLICCDETEEAVVIDPGADPERILRAVEEAGVHVAAIVNTHGHFDHIAANGPLKEATGADVWVHPFDADMLTDGNLNGSALFFGLPRAVPPADRFLEDGDEVSCGKIAMKVIHAPGHSPGSVLLLAGGHIFCGDTLFRGSIGRWDLPGGSFEALIRSIRDRLLRLGDDIVVHPGHGSETTIGYERRYNPFLTDGTVLV